MIELRPSKIEEIYEVYHDKYIIDNISQDGRNINPIFHPLVKYYSAFVNNEFVGCFLHIQFTKYEVELHSLLKKKAIKQSVILGQMIIDETFKDSNVIRITANILSSLPKAINYCLKLGFNIEGIKKNSSLKNGIIQDIYILGLYKNERRS